MKDYVFFSDDFEEEGSLASVESVALVDFNKLNVALEGLSGKVHFIIDHHVDSELYLDTLKEKEIKLVGSAVTLIAQRILAKGSVDAGLALFLSAAISLDSYNFLDSVYNVKWTDEDAKIFQALQELNQSLKEKPSDHWAKLDSIKFDIKSNLDLGCPNLLLKDYKTYEQNKAGCSFNIGIALVVIPINQFIEHFTAEKVAQHSDEFMLKQDLSLFMIMTDYQDDTGYHKEILVYGKCQEICQLPSLLQALEADKEFSLCNKRTFSDEMTAWDIGNPQKNRKHLEKYLKDFYSSQ